MQLEQVVQYTQTISQRGGGGRGLASPWISEMYVFQEILGLTLQFTIFTFIFLI